MRNKSLVCVSGQDSRGEKCPLSKVSCPVLVHSPKGIITVIVIYLDAFVLLASCRLNVKSGWTPAAAAFASDPSIYLSIRIAKCLFVVVEAGSGTYPFQLCIECHFICRLPSCPETFASPVDL